MAIKIKFFGVRGSIAVSGSKYDRFGGNTTCVYIDTGKDKLIIDAGTGIRRLGNELLAREFSKGNGKAHLLFTHTHWDHIQGFPFFVPAYIPGNELNVYGETKLVKNPEDKKEELDIEKALMKQQHFMFFPVDIHQMSADMIFYSVAPEENVELESVKIEFLRMRHPNDTLGIKLNFENSVYVFCTDIEHNESMIEAIADFASGADYLAYDAQYFPEEYESKKGYGHSTYEIGVEICKKADVRTLHLIHHDPSHSDIDLIEKNSRAVKLFKNTETIYEDYEFTLK